MDNTFLMIVKKMKMLLMLLDEESNHSHRLMVINNLIHLQVLLEIISTMAGFTL